MIKQYILVALLVLNGLMETWFGAYLVFQPENLCLKMGCQMTTDQSFILVSQMYGLVALCLGLLSFSLISSVRNNTTPLNVLAMFTLFHLGMAVIQWDKNPNVSAAAPHIVFGILFLFYLALHWRSKTKGSV